jgi:hypothetical protein
MRAARAQRSTRGAAIAGGRERRTRLFTALERRLSQRSAE